MARRRYSTSCDDSGKITNKLMKPTADVLSRAKFICTQLAKGIPSLGLIAGDAAECLEKILMECENESSDDEEVTAEVYQAN